MLLLGGIAYLRKELRRKDFITTLHNIRAHTNIWGSYLADVAAKLVVAHYESLPETQKLKVAILKTAPRPPHLVMYTVKPYVPLPHLGTGPTRPHFADLGGQFRRSIVSRCTFSFAPHNNSDFNSEMRSYAAFTRPPCMDASSLIVKKRVRTPLKLAKPYTTGLHTTSESA
jgi:hypothetical protein